MGPLKVVKKIQFQKQHKSAMDEHYEEKTVRQRLGYGPKVQDADQVIKDIVRRKMGDQTGA